ncbi:Alpha/Beta hydrolase protein [Geopyxis carbonaria]|nr:Alpha/Beta hydrolase protein [Geopyxis carbonaria]
MSTPYPPPTTHTYSTTPYPPPTTHTYSTTRTGTPITLDVYTPAASSKTLLYFHGGGLFTGCKTAPLQALLFTQLHAAGYTVLVPDYRLLLESTGWDQRADLAGLEAWLLTSPAARDLNLDLQNLAVGGGSAGAYLAMLIPDVWTTLRPRAVLCFFGMVDVADAWYTRRKQPGVICAGVPVDELRGEWWEELFVPGREEVVSDPVDFVGERARFRLVLWVLREGLIMDLISGHWNVAGHSGPKPAGDIKHLTPLELVKPGYPPVVAVHGDADSIVPIEGMHHLMARLEEEGVEGKLLVVPGADHGLQPEAKYAEYIVESVEKLGSWIVIHFIK